MLRRRVLETFFLDNCNSLYKWWDKIFLPPKGTEGGRIVIESHLPRVKLLLSKH